MVLMDIKALSELGSDLAIMVLPFSSKEELRSLHFVLEGLSARRREHILSAEKALDETFRSY